MSIASLASASPAATPSVTIVGAPSGAATPAVACGETAIPLASASTFAALGGSSVTNTGPTRLTGDLGVSPGTSIVGFAAGSGTYTGTEYRADGIAMGAQANVTIAYNDAKGLTNCPVSVAGNLGGQTLTPGLYKSTSTLGITSGDLTLSGGGNPNGVFVFQVASSFTTTSGRTVILSDGAQAGNVFWQIGSSATIGTTSVVQGTILASASITMNSGSTLDGRALAESGDVTLADSTIVVPTTSTPTSYPVTFTESGLPAATSWAVTLGGTLVSSTTATVVFNLVSGTYAYSVDLAGYIASPASGSVTVSGASASQAISFAAGAAGTSTATFTETGLAAGTSWSVTLNGVLTASVTATIAFSALVSGTYAYSVGIIGNFTATPSTGSVLVNGSPVTQGISFAASNSPAAGGSSMPLWAWVVIGVVAAGAVGAGVAMAMRRNKKPSVN
ncbi:MAG: ice-binding family protein [Thermoplasmata archaeon]